MAVGEFDLIARWFSRPVRRAVLGGGDDCALIAPAPGLELAISCDMLVEGRHFLSTVPPQRLGHKALAVNLSDLAACGAKPLAFTLALALPRSDEAWLEGFASGLYALASDCDIELIGGDTTAGPLNICITVFGEVPPGRALRRDGARAGDALWVSHPPGRGIGDARLALEAFRGRVDVPAPEWDAVRAAMETPQPRIALGIALREVASAAIDLSDGLTGDLGHVLARSRVGAVIDLDALPMSPALAGQSEAVRRDCLLGGGDDYELLFSAPPDAEERVRAAADRAGVAVSRIGCIESGSALRLVGRRGPVAGPAPRGFDHFAV